MNHSSFIPLFFNSSTDYDTELYIINASVSKPASQTAFRTFGKYLKDNNLWNKAHIIYPFYTDATNPLIYTEDYSGSAWNRTATTVTASSIDLPSGIATGSLLVPTAVSSLHEVFQNRQFYNQQNQTFSVYAKAAGYNWIRMKFVCSGNNFYQKTVWFDLQNGVFGATPVGGANLVGTNSTSLGNGWYRIEMTVQNNSDTGQKVISCYIAPQTTDGESTFTGDGISGIKVTGAQLDYVGTSATPYEPHQAEHPGTLQGKFNFRDARDADEAFRITWASERNTTFTNLWGVTPGNSSGHGISHFTPSSHLIPTSASLGVFSTIIPSSGAARFEFGSYSGVNSFQLGVGYDFNSKLRGRINSDVASNVFPPGDTRGFTMMTRNDASFQKVFKDGVLLETTPAAVGGLPVDESFVLSSRDFGGAANYFTHQFVGMIIVSDGYSDAEVELLNTGVHNLQVALGRQLIY